MIELSKTFVLETVNQFSEKHENTLRKLLSNNVFFDKIFIDDAFEQLGTFVLYLSLDTVHDVPMFNKEIQVALSLSHDYETYGHYTFEVLYNAFMATNDCLNSNAMLKSELSKLIQFDRVKLAIASHYISYDFISRDNFWCIENFVNHPRLGLNFDIEVKQKQIKSNLSNETLKRSSPVSDALGSALVLEELTQNQQVLKLIESWSEDLKPSMKIKEQSMRVFLGFLASLNDLKELTLYKRVDRMLCTLNIKRGSDVIKETLNSFGQIRVIQHTGFQNILWLDYFNNLNFAFNDSSET